MPRGIPNQNGQHADDSTDDGSKVETTSPFVTDSTQATPEPEKVTSAKVDAKKPETHAQKARKEAEAAQAEAEKAELDRAESFSVIFPTGISVLAPEGVHEVKVVVGGREQWIDVENGHVHLPKGTLIRAASVAELEDLRQKAILRFVESIANEAH